MSLVLIRNNVLEVDCLFINEIIFRLVEQSAL